MARRILNRKDLRAANDAAERRLTGEADVADEVAGDEDEDEEAPGAVASDAEGAEDEDAPVVAKKKKAAPKVKAAPKPRSRSRAAKVMRLRVVWGVFNNANQCVASFPYPQKADAEAQAAKLTADQRNTHFVQPVKEAIAEQKE